MGYNGDIQEIIIKMSSQIIRMGIKLKDGSCVSISVCGSGMGKMEGRGSFSKILNKCVEE